MQAVDLIPARFTDNLGTGLVIHQLARLRFIG